MAGNGDWISASDALNLVESRLGGRAAAKDTLAEMLRDGLIRARATEAWGSDIDDIIAAREGSSSNVIEHDPEEEIQTDFRQSAQWADDVDSWWWPESFFKVTISRKAKEYLCYRDVSMHKDDVASIGLFNVPYKTDVKRGGRRPDLQRWHNFWMEVVQIARDGHLVPGQIASQAALREDILAAMIGDPLSEESIKEPVRRIWQRFCED